MQSPKTKIIRPPFQSYYGLMEMVLQGDNLSERLSKILNDSYDLLRDPSKHHKDEYSHIRLIDTFFSDSFSKDAIKSVIGASKVTANGEAQFNVQILILDPTSSAAILRGRELGNDPIAEVNKALAKILLSIAEYEKQPQSVLGKIEKTVEEDNLNSSYLLQQLDAINKVRLRYSIEIKFYTSPAEVPVYLVSRFILKGLILHKRSAVNNPWMIFIDDPYQPFDIYDTLSKSFKSIWRTALEVPLISLEFKKERPNFNANELKNVFISYGKHSVLKRLITYEVKDRKFNPVLLDIQNPNEQGILKKLGILTRQCHRAVVLLSKDDQVEEGQRARQNVIHELGWCQALFGLSNVLMIIEDGVGLPSNIDITSMPHATFDGRDISSINKELTLLLRG